MIWWQDDLVTRWFCDNMTGRHDNLVTRWHHHSMIWWRDDQGTRWLGDEIIWWQDDLVTRWFGDKKILKPRLWKENVIQPTIWYYGNLYLIEQLLTISKHSNFYMGELSTIIFFFKPRFLTWTWTRPKSPSFKPQNRPRITLLHFFSILFSFLFLFLPFSAFWALSKKDRE